MKSTLNVLAIAVASATATRIDHVLMSGLGDSSHAREKVARLIVDEYTSQAHDFEKRLEDAFEAMHLSEKDGEPIPIAGYDFLFVGSVGASLNEEALRKKGITHIINWSSSARCDVFEDINYTCLDHMHTKKTMIKHIDEFDEAVDLVESIRKSGGKVLSHCWFGRNRSVSLLVAYLMKYQHMGMDEATDLIKRTRHQADPWLEAIDEWSSVYLTKTSSSASEGVKWEHNKRVRRLR